MNWKNGIISSTGKKEISGLEYEALCAKYLITLGFSNIETTKNSGDQGVDVIAYKNGYKYAIQCKYYSSPVGNSAVQEVIAGALFYNCNKKIVMTNSSFTQSAIDLAACSDVKLMPDITEEVIYSSLSFVKYNTMELYTKYKHSLPKKESFFGYVSYADLEKLYKDKVMEVEKDYGYLRHKNIEKYKPTNSYNNSSLNFLFGINDRLNKTLEGFALKILKIFLDDGLLNVESTRLRSKDNDSFIISFKNKSRKRLNPLQLECIKAHLNYAGVQCSYDIETVNDYSFNLIISRRKQTNTDEAFQLYDELKKQYNHFIVKERNLTHYTDGYLSRKWFSTLEEAVFENVGYFLLFQQNTLPTNYILDPIELHNVEYDSSKSIITFNYFCGVDFRFFKNPTYRKYRKDNAIENDKKYVLKISADVFPSDYYIITNDLTFSKPLSPSRIKTELTDLEEIKRNHPLAPTGNISLLHAHDIIVETGTFLDFGLNKPKISI